jgi:hypothetical protein
MKLLNMLTIFLLISSCATRKKTVIYSALATSLAGAMIGKAVSPNESSNSVNMAGGMIVGAIVGGVYGDSVYKDRHPNIEMKELPLDLKYPSNSPEKYNELSLSNLGIPAYMPEIKESTERKYVQVDKEHQGIVQKQYVIEHVIDKRSIITPNGKKYIYPKMKILEVGVESE